MKNYFFVAVIVSGQFEAFHSSEKGFTPFSYRQFKTVEEAQSEADRLSEKMIGVKDAIADAMNMAVILNGESRSVDFITLAKHLVFSYEFIEVASVPKKYLYDCLDKIGKYGVPLSYEFWMEEQREHGVFLDEEGSPYMDCAKYEH